MKELMLTTLDNPFNPFDQFDEWYSFDESNGYHTCGYIARIACLADGLSESEEIELINDAITEIAALNVIGNYKIVEK